MSRVSKDTLRRILIVLYVILQREPVLTISYDILAIFSFSGISHHAVSIPLITELTKRGHNVTVYNTFRRRLNLPGLIEYDLTPCFNQTIANDKWRIDEILAVSTIEYASRLYSLMPTVEEVVNCRPLQELIETDRKYHLLLTEYFLDDWPLGFAKKFNLPIVGVSSGTSFLWISNRVALPEYPSYVRYGQLELKNPPAMDFLERLRNVYSYVVFQSFYQYYAYTVTDRILERLFAGPSEDFPSVDQIALNTSLILINSHFSVNLVRPLTPAIVEIGGISLGPTTPLPKDVEKFINESLDGVIYFSMGSVIPSTTFPRWMKDAFLKAFSKLSVRVIWKFEEHDLPGKPENVLISKWFPQRSILSHPKVRLFISHCGQTSISEAVYEAVPVLGVPIFADQIDNANAFVMAGAGEKLDVHQLSEDVILEKINLILRDERYKVNARKLSSIFKDRPMSPMDTAMYWIEYVIRHKGAHHIRSPAVGMPWYKYFLIDVIFTVLSFVIILIFILYYTLRFTFSTLAGIFSSNEVKAKIN